MPHVIVKLWPGKSEPLISLSFFASVASQAQTIAAQAPTSSSIKIARSDSLQSNQGSDQYFTGSVHVQQLFPVNDPSRTSGGKVTFEAGARSAWHAHPLGQILIVTIHRPTVLAPRRA